MKEPLPYFYKTEVEWSEGRSGELRAANLPSLRVAAPPEFNGEEGMWTPEHLFVASVNACFVTTFRVIAQNSKLEVLSLSAAATGKLEKVDGAGLQFTEIVLKPRLVVRSGRDAERAGRILAKAEEHCLVSSSIKTVVKLEPEIYNESGERAPSASR